MTVAGIALLVYVFGKQDMRWEGAGTAWMIGMMIDAALYAWFAYCYFKPSL